MAFYKRRKNSRQRGSKTHGWGAMKKHRGSGNKGGAGNAGSGKRADSKKPSNWADPYYFGKHGFVPKNSVTYNAVNVSFIEEKLASLVSRGLARQESGSYAVNLGNLGYNKLLSSGTITKKFIVTTPYASQRAIEKVRQAGGDVLGLKLKKGKKQKIDTAAPKKKEAAAEAEE